MLGFMEKILRIDLTDGRITVERPDPSLYRKYIGGVGLGAYYLYNETDENTDPLGPDNRLIFTTGPFNGTGIPSSGRHSVVAKSPLTGIWGEADVGGSWGNKLKAAGYDGVIVYGQAKDPVYIYINEDDVRIEDASALWGNDTFETDIKLKKQHGESCVTQCIGQGGENLVKFASIMTDGTDARAAGRCGLGAVMGSKKLKAIVVDGNKKTEIAESEALRSEIRDIAKFQVENRGGMHEHGTAEGLIGNELSGDLPIKNWKLGAWDGKSEKLTGEVLTEKYLTGRFHCGNCVVGCGRTIEVKEGPYALPEAAGPEFESICCLGPNTLVENMEAVIKANDLCNRYGLDTISAGSVIAFAMECRENGLISAEDTDGLEIEWGSEDVLIELVERITFRRNIGDILAEGVRFAAEKIGGLAEEFAIHTKGLEFPAHEPRVLNGAALSYATSNRGACHNADLGSRFYERKLVMPEIGQTEPHGTLSVEGKGPFIAGLQNIAGLYDSLKVCKFMVWFGVDNANLLRWLNQVTGWGMSMEEFIEAGERIFNLKRLYNVRHGISRKNDNLPVRIQYSPRGEGGDGHHVPPLPEMLNQYYIARGWNEFGIPTDETRVRLSL